MDKFITKIRLKKLSNILHELYKESSNYQIVEILLSVMYLFVSRLAFKITFILSIIGVDLFGELIHKKYKGASKEYEKNNIAVDRITELFIFSAELSHPLGRVFLFLAILNTLLSYHKLNTGKNFILELKLLYLYPLCYRLIFI